MNFHSNTPTDEVIKWLREKSIAGSMPAAFINKLDELRSVEDLDVELEEAHEQITALEKDRDNLIEELTELRAAFLRFLEHGDPDDKKDRAIADQALEIAQSAIERHTPK